MEYRIKTDVEMKKVSEMHMKHYTVLAVAV